MKIFVQNPNELFGQHNISNKYSLDKVKGKSCFIFADGIREGFREKVSSG